MSAAVSHARGHTLPAPGGHAEWRGRPHLISPAVMGAVPCHAALWHCVRDLAHSILVYRGIWDQTGPGYLTRVINEHGHFRDVVPYHWGLFEQLETEAQPYAYAIRSFVEALDE